MPPSSIALSYALALLLPLAIGCEDRQAQARPTARDSVSDSSRSSRANTADSSRADTARTPGPIMAPPLVVRALYVNRWVSLGTRMWHFIALGRTTEVNALVMDVKDDRGFVLYRSRVPLAKAIGADTNRPMSDARIRLVLDSMRAAGMYPIARIVVAKDPLLAEHRRDWAIKRRDDSSQPWLDKNGRPWLDPHQTGVWDYAVDLAAEAVALGFSEVQLDYVRFPDEKRLVRETVYPLAAGRARAQVIRDQLAHVRARLKPLGVPLTIDVFGLTTSDTTDMGIGQRWESFIDMADAVLPMTYPSHYAPGSYRISSPNARPYDVIDRALVDARRRSAGIAGAARVVPWYQDFTLGAPRYGRDEVRAQIRAGYANGFPSWALWNPGSRYTESALASRADLMRVIDSVRLAPPNWPPPARPATESSALPSAADSNSARALPARRP